MSTGWGTPRKPAGPPARTGRRKKLWLGCGGLIAALLVLLISVALATTSTKNSTTSATSPSRASSSAPHSSAPVRSSAAPTHASPSTPAPARSPSSAHPVRSTPAATASPLPLGALNPAVTQATISSTICVTDWTTTVRPSSAYTEELKRTQLAAEKVSDQTPGDYEEDHIIPLELGGAPSDPRNLRPIPLAQAAHDDRLENTLHRAVCAGTMSLTGARARIAAAKLHEPLSATPSRTATTSPRATRPVPPPRSSPAVGSSSGATARCRDGTLSFAAHHQGACSHHRGVAQWYH